MREIGEKERKKKEERKADRQKKKERKIERERTCSKLLPIFSLNC